MTLEQIEAAKTKNGGWTKDQLTEWGIAWPPPKGWKHQLLNKQPFTGLTLPPSKPDLSAIIELQADSFRKS